MPRSARTVFAGIPHHVTQRGNRRDDVFFGDADRRAYLDWLREYCAAHAVDIIAYCLMTNHVHLIAAPEQADGLHRALKPLHMRYAQRVNRRQEWTGHLWQGRFYSAPLDESYLWAAIRYVERNPVRADFVWRAEDYPWSSAAAHCGLRKDPALTGQRRWGWIDKHVPDWSAWLAGEEDMPRVDAIRRHTMRGLPCGSDAFVGRLEKIAGRPLKSRPRGRPKRKA